MLKGVKRSVCAMQTVFRISIDETACGCRYYTIKPPKELGSPPARFRDMPEINLEPSPPQKTYQELLQEDNMQFIGQSIKPLNIGVDWKPVDTRVQRLNHATANRKNRKLEKITRLRELKVELDDVYMTWQNEFGPAHEKTNAEHYGLYRDLFHGNYFYPVTPLAIAYEYDQDLVTPVYRGNIIPPSEARNRPLVDFDQQDDYFYSLVMTAPDSHLHDNNVEYLHWMLLNIKDGDVSSGEEMCKYLQPIPCQGTGFHRYIFILLRHQVPISDESLKLERDSLGERTFEINSFYQKYNMQPMGLRFYQSEWDYSVSDVFKTKFGTKEPAFEYQYPAAYHPKQVTYPRGEPFDRYFDRYRDKKELREEVLKMKLEMTSPFEDPMPRFKYPNIHRPENVNRPTWLRKRDDIINRRLEQYRLLPK